MWNSDTLCVLPARRYASALIAVIVCPSVRPSVCLSQVGVLLRRLNLWSPPLHSCRNIIRWSINDHVLCVCRNNSAWRPVTAWDSLFVYQRSQSSLTVTASDRLVRLDRLAASSVKHNVTACTSVCLSACLSVCLSRRHTHLDSPRGSMQHGQRAIKQDNKEHRYSCLFISCGQ